MYRRVIAGVLTGCVGLFVGVLTVAPSPSGANFQDTVEIPRTVTITLESAPPDDPTSGPTLPPQDDAKSAAKPKQGGADKSPRSTTPTPSPADTPRPTPSPAAPTKEAEPVPSPSATETPALTPEGE